MTIHAEDPFATPEDERSQVRRLRARLPAAVTLWTAYGRDHRPAGLTVSSTLVVDGDPGHVLGLLDEESELFEAIRDSGRFVVMPLRVSDSRLADTFAGVVPVPGGPFTQRSWVETDWGPVLADDGSWAGCLLTEVRPLGWGQLVEASIAHMFIARGDGRPSDGEEPLIYHRGRYVRRLTS